MTQYARTPALHQNPLPKAEVKILAAEVDPAELGRMLLDSSALSMHSPVPHWALSVEVKVTKKVSVKLEATVVQRRPLKEVRRSQLQREIQALQCQLAELD